MPGHWINFMVTAAEAAAALTGLVMVAISVNLAKILSYPQLPIRAAATIATLILVVVVGLAALIPQSVRALGPEVMLGGIVCWLLQVRATRKILMAAREKKRPMIEVVLVLVLGQAQTLPFIAAGSLLMMGHESGYYWIAGGSIAIFVFSTINAWILRVEILR